MRSKGGDPHTPRETIHALKEDDPHDPRETIHTLKEGDPHAPREAIHAVLHTLQGRRSTRSEGR
jgi:hypothetical protein